MRRICQKYFKDVAFSHSKISLCSLQNTYSFIGIAVVGAQGHTLLSTSEPSGFIRGPTVLKMDVSLAKLK